MIKLHRYGVCCPLRNMNVLMHWQIYLLYGGTYYIIRGIPCSLISKDLLRVPTGCCWALSPENCGPPLKGNLQVMWDEHWILLDNQLEYIMFWTQQLYYSILVAGLVMEIMVPWKEPDLMAPLWSFLHFYFNFMNNLKALLGSTLVQKDGSSFLLGSARYEDNLCIRITDSNLENQYNFNDGPL